MKNSRLWASVFIALIMGNVAAQVTGSGTSGTVPVFVGTSAIGNSPLTVSGNNVGIGTTTPSAPLEVNGGIQISAPNFGFGAMTLGNHLANAGDKGWLIRANSDVSPFDGKPNSLGFEFWNGPNPFFPLTLTPDGGVDISGALTVSAVNLDPAGGYSLVPLQNSGKLLLGWNYVAGQGETDIIANRGPGSLGGFKFFDYSNSGVLSPLLTMQSTGNIGIGTTAPGKKLEVVGNIKLSMPGTGIVFPDGSVQTLPWTGSLCGGDYAESMDVSGDRTKYEPGDVLQLDPNAPGNVLKVTEPYSQLVAGIYSTKPGVLGRRQTTDPKVSTTEVPMAMVGVVPTKVSAENGPIKVGDLLVTSSTPGHAMKGTDRSLMLGAIVGKAMGNFDSGKGVIEVLVTLQ